MNWEEQLRALGPDWDGGGADPIKSEVIDQVVAFVARNNFSPLPKIVPSPDGCVIIGFCDDRQCYLEIEFDGNEITYMLALPGGRYWHWK